MKLGIHLPFKGPDGEVNDGKAVMGYAAAIEQAGFEGTWIGDGISAMARPDPLSWLLVGAMAAPSLEIGTCIFQVPLRNPVELAQRFMTLHTLTNGRFTVGAGTGSGDRGYRAMPEFEFAHRFKKMREDLKIMRRLMNGEVVGEANLYPWPAAKGGPPILIGSWSNEKWLKRAAQQYEGWMPSGSFGKSKAKGDEQTFNSLKENIDKFHDFGGTRAALSSVMTDLTQPEHHLADDEPFNLRCGPESAMERLTKLAELGYTDALLVKTQPGRGLYEADLTAEDLQSLRGLYREPALAK